MDVGNYESVSPTFRTFSHVNVSRSKTFRFCFAHHIISHTFRASNVSISFRARNVSISLRAQTRQTFLFRFALKAFRFRIVLEASSSTIHPSCGTGSCGQGGLQTGSYYDNCPEQSIARVLKAPVLGSKCWHCPTPPKPALETEIVSRSFRTQRFRNVSGSFRAQRFRNVSRSPGAGNSPSVSRSSGAGNYPSVSRFPFRAQNLEKAGNYTETLSAFRTSTKLIFININ